MREKTFISELGDHGGIPGRQYETPGEGVDPANLIVVRGEGIAFNRLESPFEDYPFDNERLKGNRSGSGFSSHLITSVSDASKVECIDRSFSAAASFNGAHAELGYSTKRAAESMTRVSTVTWIGSMWQYGGYVVVPDGAKMKDDATNLLNPRHRSFDLARFRKTYGTAYVSKLHKGVQVLAYFSARSRKDWTSDKISSELAIAFSYASLSVEARAAAAQRISTHTESLIENLELEVAVQTIGGPGLPKLANLSRITDAAGLRTLLDVVEGYLSTTTNQQMAVMGYELKYFREFDTVFPDGRERNISRLSDASQNLGVLLEATKYLINEVPLEDSDRAVLLRKMNADDTLYTKVNNLGTQWLAYSDRTKRPPPMLGLGELTSIPLSPNRDPLLQQYLRKYPRVICVLFKQINFDVPVRPLTMVLEIVDDRNNKNVGPKISVPAGYTANSSMNPMVVSELKIKPDWRTVTIHLMMEGGGHAYAFSYANQYQRVFTRSEVVQQYDREQVLEATSLPDGVEYRGKVFFSFVTQ